MQIKFEDNITPIRIDLFLESKLEDKSRSQIQKLIQQGHILVNQKPIKKNYILEPNDDIIITFPEPTTQLITPISKPLTIVFEDDDILVIEKPANLSVHQDINQHQKETLINLLIGNNIKLSSLGGIHRPGIVHRLDKDTSGLLIIAKNDQSHHHLQKQFANKQVQKTYLTLVLNKPETNSGTINAPIIRDKVDRKKMSISNDPKARQSTTHFKTINTFKLPSKTTQLFSLLEVNIETGRTHQIRVHMNSIKHPVIGDTKYGSHKINLIFQELGLNRQFLHAHKLIFTHPKTEKEMQFTSPLSPDLQLILEKLTLI